MSARAWLPLGLAAGAAAAFVLGRRQVLRWGATKAECARVLPGDGLVESADIVATRAITIAAPPQDVWPWLVQLGQGRGGFYSYDALENMIGLDIHSADTIEERWQNLEVGDRVQLAAQLGLVVAHLDPGRAFVLIGSDQDFNEGMNTAPFDFTWTFVVEPGEDYNSRLIIRERYATHSRAARVMVEGVTWVSFVMTERMLRGIRDRAEQYTTGYDGGGSAARVAAGQGAPSAAS